MKKYSPFLWAAGGALGISFIFYLIQAAGMQSWSGPWYLFKIRWYFILPLVLGFAIQAGLFRAIHLKTRHGGGGTMAASGGVSSATMAACCLHNFIAFLPLLGISGLAVFVSAYQSYIFLASIAFVFGGVIYMWNRYKRICGSINLRV